MLKEKILSLLNDEDYLVSIRNAGKYKFPADYKFESHKHSEIEINYINTGYCVMGVGDDYVPLKEGDCIIIKPYIFHSFMVDKSKSCSITQLEYSIVVPDAFLDALSVFNKEGDNYVKVTSGSNLLRSLENVCRCYRELTDNDECSCLQLDLALAQLYVVLSSAINEHRLLQSEKDHGVVGGVIKYINKNFEEELSLEKIAADFHISDRSIRKYFNKYLGMNYTQYISMLRIAKAKALLWNSTKSITDIAMMTGFNSSQYFSRVFYKHTNTTPGEYRKMWRGTKADV